MKHATVYDNFSPPTHSSHASGHVLLLTVSCGDPGGLLVLALVMPGHLIPSFSEAFMGFLIAHTFRVRTESAQQVYLIGDFNNWSTTSHPLVEFSPGVWETTLSLDPGKHAYAYFVVDKRWEPGRQPVGPRTRVLGRGSAVWVPQEAALGTSVVTGVPELQAA